MSEMRDSYFMLFGKTIAFPRTQVSDADVCVADAASDHGLSSVSDSCSPEQELERDRDDFIFIDQQLNKEAFKDEQEDATRTLLASNNDSTKAPSADSETECDTQDKTLKKPDKIVPCPRCNSMDTKFCYYNNYNVKQPRHFCKNCQRYWTSGGTMRSVPVGAGRRKNKNSTASHYRHISEALQMARINAAKGIHSPSLRNKGSVLTFGSDSPQMQNGFHRPDQRVLVPCGGKDNGDDRSSGCGSSITGSSSSDKVGNSGLQEARVENCQGFAPQAPCFPGPQWHCAWNSTLHPVSFYPAPAYWGCTVMGSWDMPHASSSPDNSASNSSPSSAVLGKHLRDGKMINPSTMSGGGLFKAFQFGGGKYQAVGASAALRANPAALSRSLNFQEST